MIFIDALFIKTLADCKLQSSTYTHARIARAVELLWALRLLIAVAMHTRHQHKTALAASSSSLC